MSGGNHKINHLLVIVDGNRRYARNETISYLDSYKKSVDKIHQMIGWLSVEEGIPVVSFYILAQYNFNRPPEEITPIFDAALYAMTIFPEHNGSVRYRVCGSLENFPDDVEEKIAAIDNSGNAEGNLVNLLIGYSGMEELRKAMMQCDTGNSSITEKSLLQHSSLGPYPIDVLVRTGGVVRLSDGPLIGVSQTRMYPIDKLFAEVEREDLMSVIDDFRTGKRV